MDRHNEIAQLLKKYFGDYDFLEPEPRCYQTDKIKCRYRRKKECNVSERKEPIWTPRFGDDKTDVMIVAEAPSNAGGPGLHVGGLLSKCAEKDNSPLYRLRDFVKHKDNYGTIPYFTNLVKCGVARQERGAKHNLGKRAETCAKALLLEEIQIMKPRIILCVGALPHEYLKKHQSELKRIGILPEVHQLTHYGHQAGLHLRIDDKINLIWKCEAGLIPPEEVSLSELSHFKSERTKR